MEDIANTVKRGIILVIGIYHFFTKEYLGKMKTLVAWLLCFALCFPVSLPAAGAEPEETVVRVGWYDSSFNQTDGSGRRSGYAYDYQMKIAAYAGWKYEYIQGSWSDLLDQLLRGEIDLLSDVSFTPERAGKILFPALSMGSEEYYLFISAKNREISSSSLSALNGKRVGVNRNSIQAQYLRDWEKQHRIGCEIVELTCTEDESLQKLDDGELDAYVTVDTFTQEKMLAPDRPVPVTRIGSSDIYFAVSASRPDLLAQLESAMTRIREESRSYADLLYDRYFLTTGANSLLNDAELAWLAGHGAIRVGYQDNYLAFCASDPETGELTGALKDYLSQAADCVHNAHLDFHPVAFPTASAALEALQRGEVDCVFPANLSTGDADALGLFMTPSLMRTDVFAVVRHEHRALFANREHMVVAVNEGNPNYTSYLNSVFPSWHVITFPTTEDCLRAVSRGVADCVLISSYRYSSISRLCEQEGLTTVTAGRGLDYCFAVASGNPELYSILARVADLVPDSSANATLSRYIADESRKTTLKDIILSNLWVVIAVVAAVLLVILVLMFRSMKAVRKASRLISATETDRLTGLYNRDYFLQYAGTMRKKHPDIRMDAVVLNIDRFHSVNALSGRSFGDLVLQTLGSELHDVAQECGGIAGRFGADRFDIYCRPQPDYQSLYDRLQKRMDGLAPSANIRLRMGVMPWQPELDVVQQFDRARTACSRVRNHFSDHLIIVDSRMLEQENYEQRLMNDLHRALSAYEFEVYYQPQFDIQCDPPRMVGAEALVRWNHPELGLIPPGDFIPLFESSGKISEVDRYVWAETARQIARWRAVFGVTVPVSVNLSRVDVFDPELESVLDRLIADNVLKRSELKLEVTESAYTDKPEQVIQVVESLRRKGYVVEMDDFGTGYSSLNMLSAMTVDVLKMDRTFIRQIGESKKDSELVTLILGLARNLKIPVVAEGVENETQLRLLRELGCQMVQGFYFSRPLPVAEFEEKMIRAGQDKAGQGQRG